MKLRILSLGLALSACVLIGGCVNPRQTTVTAPAVVGQPTPVGAAPLGGPAPFPSTGSPPPGYVPAPPPSSYVPPPPGAPCPSCPNGVVPSAPPPPPGPILQAPR